MTETTLKKNVFQLLFVFLMWSMSHPLTWSRDLWPFPTARHQVAMEKLWLHCSGAVMSSISIHSVWLQLKLSLTLPWHQNASCQRAPITVPGPDHRCQVAGPSQVTSTHPGIQELICLFQCFSRVLSCNNTSQLWLPGARWAGTIKLDGCGSDASQELQYEPLYPASSYSLVPFNGHLIWLTNLQGI